MLGIDISTLSRAELKRLLALAREREQDALVRQLQAELARRDAGGERARATPADPAFGDEEPEPIRLASALPGLSFDRHAPPRRGGRSFWPIGVAAAAVALAGIATWGLMGAPPADTPSSPASKPAATPRLAVARTAPVPPAPTPSAIVPPSTTAAPAPATAKPAVRPRPAHLDPCGRPPTPADRLVCNDLALDMLDHEMRDAYGRAMQANADPLMLRETQAAWRRARDPISDPQSLARAYDRRIKELEAATARAQAAQPPPEPGPGPS